jgi:hypothetical protein
MQIIDALDLPAPAAILAAGYHGVIGYTRAVTRDYLEECERVGLPIALYFETAADRVLGGGPNGHHDGQLANHQVDAICWPHDAPIIYTADIDITDETLGVAGVYVAAAGSEGRRAFIYGDNQIVNFCLDRGYAAGGILAGASSWSRPGLPAEYAAAQKADQVRIAGKVVDVLDVRLPDWGQVPRPTPAEPAPTQGEDIMVTKEELAELFDEHTKRLELALVEIASNVAQLAHHDVDELGERLGVPALDPFTVNIGESHTDAPPVVPVVGVAHPGGVFGAAGVPAPEPADEPAEPERPAVDYGGE